jgi:hypothetical protein
LLSEYLIVSFTSPSRSASEAKRGETQLRSPLLGHAARNRVTVCVAEHRSPISVRIVVVAYSGARASGAHAFGGVLG